MGTVEKRDKHKKRRFVSPEEKLERELKDCMHCRFFWGHNNSGSSGNAGGKPVRNPEREKPKWEDTITNRMLHWSYTPEQKEELKMALAAGIPRATILTYFYPEVTVEKMSSYRKKQ